MVHLGVNIIPQQETLGNYNAWGKRLYLPDIIPQQETLGNYNYFEV